MVAVFVLQRHGNSRSWVHQTYQKVPVLLCGRKCIQWKIIIGYTFHAEINHYIWFLQKWLKVFKDLFETILFVLWMIYALIKGCNQGKNYLKAPNSYFILLCWICSLLRGTSFFIHGQLHLFDCSIVASIKSDRFKTWNYILT